MKTQSYFPIVEYEEASAEIKAIYDETMVMMDVPFVLNWFKCQASSPHLLKGNWEKLKATLLFGKIPVLLKQLILYNVSATRGCKYCTFIHQMTADGMGSELNDDPNFKVSEDLEGPWLPSSYKTAIRVVSRCALDPLSTSEKDFEDLFAEGFDETEVQELFAQADLVNMLNTIADISGIPVDKQLLEIT